MSLQERIEGDVKDAMRNKDVLRRDTLRMLVSALKNQRIDKGEDLAESDEIAVIQKAHKSRMDAAEQYENADRPELAEKEKAEAAIIEGYLPQQLNEDEVRSLVQRLISELGISDKKEIGKLMKAVMADYKGQVDGKLVQRFAGELLG